VQQLNTTNGSNVGQQIITAHVRHKTDGTVNLKNNSIPNELRHSFDNNTKRRVGSISNIQQVQGKVTNNQSVYMISNAH
jgi:hypothetical protein